MPSRNLEEPYRTRTIRSCCKIPITLKTLNERYRLLTSAMMLGDVCGVPSIALRVKTKHRLGWGLAALMFAFVWSAGGYWHDVVAVLVVVSLVVILADMKKCSTDGPMGSRLIVNE